MNRQKKIRRGSIVAGVMTILTLTGCGSLQVGEEEFSCSGMPDSVFCHSTRDVYEATMDGEVPSPMGKDKAYNEECTDCQKSHLDGGPSVITNEYGSSVANGTTGTASRDRDEVIDNYVTVALPERPIPIRTPSQVMRIWVAPFIDTNGDYNAPGFVFTEIEPRRWVLAKERESVDRVLTPLEGSHKAELDISAPKEKTPTTVKK